MTNPPGTSENSVIVNPAAGTARLTAGAQSELILRIQADREMAVLKTQGYMPPDEAAKILNCELERLNKLIQDTKFINDCLPAIPTWQHQFDAEKNLLTPEVIQKILDYDKTVETLKAEGYVTLIRAAVVTGRDMAEIEQSIGRHLDGIARDQVRKPEKPQVWVHPLRDYPLLSKDAIKYIGKSSKLEPKDDKPAKERLAQIIQDRFYTGDEVKELCGLSTKQLKQMISSVNPMETYSLEGHRSEGGEARNGFALVKVIGDDSFIRGSVVKTWLTAKLKWEGYRSKGYRDPSEVAKLSGIACAEIITQAEKLLDGTVPEKSTYNDPFTGAELYSPEFADKVIGAIEKTSTKSTTTVKKGVKSDKVGKVEQTPDGVKEELDDKKPKKKK